MTIRSPLIGFSMTCPLMMTLSSTVLRGLRQSCHDHRHGNVADSGYVLVLPAK